MPIKWTLRNHPLLSNDRAARSVQFQGWVKKKNCFNTDSVVGSGLGLLPGLFEFFGGGRDPEHVELLGEVMIPTPKGADVSSLQIQI